MKSEKGLGVLVNIAVYILAFAIGIIPYYFLVQKGIHPALSMFVYTLSATFVVYICCLLFKNTSIYDPYWSVAPFVMTMIHMVTYKLYNVSSTIFIVLMFLYAFRLTRNWFLTYKGLDPKYEDWRYARFRNKLPRWKFEIVNFFGLIYIPTLVVYAALLPGLFFMGIDSFNPLAIIGFIFMIGGPLLELIADYQSRKFREHIKDHSKTCNVGLWKYSRHPNYLGELMFWFGIAMLFLARLDVFYYVFGFVPMLLLFLFISIPMMEKHNIEKRPGYVEYKKHTSMLLILPPRK